MDVNTDQIKMTATSSTQLTSSKGSKSGSPNVPMFQQIQDAKTESENNAKYAAKAAKIVGSSRVILYLMPSMLALPLAMLINGAVRLDECPVEPYIPIYMVVAGSFSVLKLIIEYTLRMKRYCEKRGPLDEATTVEKVVDAINSLIGLFTFAFFIAGNVWVFRVYTPNFDDPTAANYCQHTIYWFAFASIVAVYGLAALGIFLCCCCCCCAAAYAAGKAAGNSQDKS
ncbi:transmembrane protein 272-like [Asterias rubens]|uniref:transmembrane protein 272-like n=1 Tax=Asterias rubens TaxID=7604 RepID=UPI001455B591|nr:transmembrane protein 272-like [Asterias rubens]